jgi:hypothetical protein
LSSNAGKVVTNLYLDLGLPNHQTKHSKNVPAKQLCMEKQAAEEWKEGLFLKQKLEVLGLAE